VKRESYFQPKLGWRILWFLLSDNERESLAGDFDEIFREKIKERGKLAAMFWYWSQVHPPDSLIAKRIHLLECAYVS